MNFLLFLYFFSNISFILHLTKSGIMLYAKMANCGQKIEEHCRNLILADSWFSSVKTAEAIHESGHEWIGVVKTSHSLFPQKELEDKLKT